MTEQSAPPGQPQEKVKITTAADLRKIMAGANFEIAPEALQEFLGADERSARQEAQDALDRLDAEYNSYRREPTKNAPRMRELEKLAAPLRTRLGIGK